MSGPINSAEAARLLGVSATTLRRLVETGELPYIRKMPGLRGAYLFEPGVVKLYRRMHPPRGRGRPPKELAS